MQITKISVNNPVFATMMMVAIMVLGIFSYQRLSVEQMPDISFPFVSVRTSYPGASSEAVMQDVTRPLEEVINTVQGIKNIRSFSREGFSRVLIEFQLNVDVKTAVQDVRDKVAGVRRGFNKDVGEPTVTREDNENDQPIMQISIESPARSLRELSDLTDQLVVKRLQGATGVGAIDISGQVQREMAVQLNPDKMAAYGISVDQVVGQIRAQNQNQAAGFLTGDRSERLVRVQGKFKSAGDFEQLIISRRGSSSVSASGISESGGAPITLGMIANVRDTEREETGLATNNGKRGLLVEIRKTRGANAIDAAKSIRANIEKLKQSLPPDFKLEITNDESESIKQGVDNVKTTILEGALLTVVIVFLFLHSWRSTVITGLTLPISVLATFIALYALGFTINFMTLMALSLSIGILIDDAIVVRENIVRHLAMGKSHFQASLDATQEIGIAVMATTFCIVAVFLPVAFMGGIIGKFFLQFGLAVSVAVLVSLFVSFTLDPMLSAVWHDSPSRLNKFKPIAWLLAKQDIFMIWLHAKYDAVLRWTLNPAYRRTWIPKLTIFKYMRSGFKRDYLNLDRVTIRNRGIVLWIAALTFFSSFLLVPAGEFVPETDNNWANASIETPVGSSLNYTMGKAVQVENALREFPEIKRITRNVSKTQAWFGLELTAKETRKRTKKQLDDAIRTRLSSIAGLAVRVGWNRPIQIFVMGPEIGELNRISQELLAKVKAIPGTVDVESSYKPTSPTLDIVVNRALASDLGVSMASIVSTTRAMIAGEDAGQWEGPDGENHQVLVRLPRNDRTAVADLDKLFVPTSALNADGSPRMVPLRQVAEFVPSFAERQIERRNLQRLIQVFSGVAATHTEGQVSDEVQKALKTITLPPGYSFQSGGSSQDMAESMGYAGAALGLAVIFIYLILASQFGSFLQPIAIMASLPLSLIGVFLSLRLFGTTLNLFSIIGFIMLMGLVTKNAILLVDFTNHSRREGMPRDDAILASGQVRLRPILMTTTAMIGGMLPLALAFGAGSEQQSPMAHAVIGGIITSTIMTLVVVPVLYTYFDTWGEKASAWFKRGAKAPSVHVHANTPTSVAGGGSIAPLPAARKDD
jgi:hydrophobic/amphiphilic exporter-1 (mainly G- bacteria), HAE1 family